MQILESTLHSIWKVCTPQFSNSAKWWCCISMLNSSPQHPEKALLGKIRKSFPTCAAEWEARCFSGIVAAPVTSEVSFEEKITSLVVLEATRRNQWISDIACLAKFPVLLHPHLLLLLVPYSSSLSSDPVSRRFLTGSHHGKKPSLSKGCLQVLFSQGYVIEPVKPQKKALTVTEKG